jgi:hypothetical protein
MNPDDRHARKAMRRALLASALIIAPALSALIGHDIGRHATAGDDAIQTQFSRRSASESVFVGKAPSATPDHALLSAADVERSLPVPARAPAMQESTTL